MEDFITTVFAWIGANENVLSGLVAIAVLLGLMGAGARRLGSRPPTNQKMETEVAQEIRYCRTTDGARIAYAATGQGTPIVRCLGWYTHLEVEWSSRLERG